VNARGFAASALLLALAPTLLAAAALTPKPAAAEPSSGDRWTYVIAPYFLAPYMNGKTGIGGVTGEVNADPGDIFDHLDFGAMVYAQARKGPWAAGLDWTYMDLGASGATALGTADLDVKQTGLTLMGFRQVTPKLEALAGLQLTSVRTGLTTTGPLAIDRSGDWTWVDPIIGGRARVFEKDKWLFLLSGDIGGFGISSDFTWQVYPVLSYRTSESLDLAVAYRAVGIDYETGSGSSKFLYDMVTFGPEIGIAFHF